MKSKYPKSPHLASTSYYDSFKDESVSKKDDHGIALSKRKAALDRAWSNRDFEIDKYWSRATYFWAFIAATFAGYIAVASSKDMDAGTKRHLGFMINCLGIIFSTAWVLVNAGSKQWQENWEKHIDMLEDEVTGPIYKTVANGRSYSVSRINKMVSVFVLLIWAMLALRGLYIEFSHTPPLAWIRAEAHRIIGSPKPEFHITIIVTLLVTAYFLRLMSKTKTKEDKERGSFSFSRREIEYKEP